MTAIDTPLATPIAVAEIQAARERIAGAAIRSPLVRLNLDEAPAEIYLKLENLQPIGSFKLRGAGNAIALADPADLARGVVTASAGNMAQGVAWNARRLGVPCTVIVPDHAPQTKLDAIARLGGRVVKVSFDDWWQIIVSHRIDGVPGVEGHFIHPVSERAVIAGNGTIGLEILENLPDVDTVIIPYGGGGLSAGIASAIRPLKPSTRIFACEVSTAAPLAPSLAAGAPQEVAYTPTFVDGIGGKSLVPEMWPLVSGLLDGSLVVTPEQVAAAIRLLVERNRVVAEGAGATPVAAALTGSAGAGKVVCVVSGGNIDSAKLAKILQGEVP
jgi:threonine dehydratase